MKVIVTQITICYFHYISFYRLSGDFNPAIIINEHVMQPQAHVTIINNTRDDTWIREMTWKDTAIDLKLEHIQDVEWSGTSPGRHDRLSSMGRTKIGGYSIRVWIISLEVCDQCCVDMFMLCLRICVIKVDLLYWITIINGY